ncbi:MAG: type II secretion system F family protein [Pseudomonadota bacterium]
MVDTFSQSWDFLVAAFGPPGPYYVIFMLAAVLIALSVPVLMRRRADPFDRLGGSGPRVAGPAAAAAAGGDAARLRYDSKNANLERLAPFLEPQNKEEYSAVRLLLMQAGYRSRSAVGTYHLARFVLGMGFLAIGVLSVLVRETPPSLPAMIFTIMVPGLVGYFMPQYWVVRRKQTRQEEITNGFPDALDLMLVCVEAGQSLDQAIMRVAREINVGFPALAEEFEIVSNEVRAGKDRTNVLRDMSERAGVADISAFVTVLIQSARFGTSISQALRVYAAEMRDKRIMRAEEKANVLPTKLTLGSMLFTVPPLLIILIGPSLYEIFDVLTGAGAGGL